MSITEARSVLARVAAGRTALYSAVSLPGEGVSGVSLVSAEASYDAVAMRRGAESLVSDDDADAANISTSIRSVSSSRLSNFSPLAPPISDGSCESAVTEGVRSRYPPRHRESYSGAVSEESYSCREVSYAYSDRIRRAGTGHGSSGEASGEYSCDEAAIACSISMAGSATSDAVCGIYYEAAGVTSWSNDISASAEGAVSPYTSAIVEGESSSYSGEGVCWSTA